MPSLRIAVVYSSGPRSVDEKVVVLEEGSTVAQALQCCGLAAHADTVGIWGKKAALDHVLRDQDRVEIYRPLTVDPKVARRERFAGQGAKKAAGLFARRRAGAKAGY